MKLLLFFVLFCASRRFDKRCTFLEIGISWADGSIVFYLLIFFNIQFFNSFFFVYMKRITHSLCCCWCFCCCSDFKYQRQNALRTMTHTHICTGEMWTTAEAHEKCKNSFRRIIERKKNKTWNKTEQIDIGTRARHYLKAIYNDGRCTRRMKIVHSTLTKAGHILYLQNWCFRHCNELLVIKQLSSFSAAITLALLFSALSAELCICTAYCLTTNNK